MDNYLRINASVVSHPGMGYSENGDNFYVNGRYRNDYEMENIQVSIDSYSDEYIFAVSDNMDRINTQKATSISMVRELKKFHESIRGKGGDIKSKLTQMSERVEEISNVIFSLDLNGSEGESIERSKKATAFSGLFITSGKFAGLSLDSCWIYLFRDESLRSLTGDNKKTDRLLRMGIITDEQAKELSRTFLKSSDANASGIVQFDTMEILPGDVFLLCTDGISNTLDEEKIFEILSNDKEPGYIANVLIREALKAGCKDSVTSLVLRVQGNNTQDKSKGKSGAADSKKIAPKKSSHSKVASVTLIICVIIAGVLLLTLYKPWLGLLNSGKIISGPVNPTPKQSQSSAEPTHTGESSTTLAPTIIADDNADTDVSERTYVVISGDNLQKISLKFYGTVDKYKDIMIKNNISDANQLSIGQLLIIP